MTKEDAQLDSLIGQTLKITRTNQPCTQEQLAVRSRISVRYLAAIENETRFPNLEVIYRLVHALGISTDDIFYPSTHQVEDKNHVARLYSNFSKRDQKSIFNLLNAMQDYPENV